MSRSGYTDDCDDQWAMICWRGAVASATRGKRGQSMLKELLAALDAMPDKRLVADTLEADGQYCTLGVLGAARGLDMTSIDPEDSYHVAKEFGIAEALAQEIVFMNDEAFGYRQEKETPERRWERMRAWVADQIIPERVAA
jgi:hypothetical protein